MCLLCFVVVGCLRSENDLNLKKKKTELARQITQWVHESVGKRQTVIK